uniref:Helicase C-terminal domain-containing protein n=2 Tax=Pinguiococcus pyrenoidosus TaxID=172671 RepID=A0A7R9UEN2_9STRA
MDANRTRAALPLMTQASRLLLLTGTPALSRPAELWPQLHAVAHDTLFPRTAQMEFMKRYCNAHQGHFGWDTSGSSNEEELSILLHDTIMVRRLKADVLAENLPAKHRVFTTVEAASDIRAEMDEHSEKMKELEIALQSGAKSYEGLGSGGTGEMLKLKSERDTLMMKLWTLAGRAKIPAVGRRIAQLLELGEGEMLPGTKTEYHGIPEAVSKIVVFAHHMEVIEELETELMQADVGYVRIDGKVPAAKRTALVDRFQEDDDVHVALLGITACNTGISFTSAFYAIFAELLWTPGDMRQAEDRIHRLGQKSRKVYYELFTCKSSMDDRMMEMLRKKDYMLATTIRIADMKSPGQNAGSTKGTKLTSIGFREDTRRKDVHLPPDQRSLTGYFTSTKQEKQTLKRSASESTAPEGGHAVIDMVDVIDSDEDSDDDESITLRRLKKKKKTKRARDSESDESPLKALPKSPRRRLKPASSGSIGDVPKELDSEDDEIEIPLPPAARGLSPSPEDLGETSTKRLADGKESDRSHREKKSKRCHPLQPLSRMEGSGRDLPVGKAALERYAWEENASGFQEKDVQGSSRLSRGRGGEHRGSKAWGQNQVGDAGVQPSGSPDQRHARWEDAGSSSARDSKRNQTARAKHESGSDASENWDLEMGSHVAPASLAPPSGKTAAIARGTAAVKAEASLSSRPPKSEAVVEPGLEPGMLEKIAQNRRRALERLQERRARMRASRALPLA